MTLAQEIGHMVAHAEEHEDCKLSSESREFLINAYTEFVARGITKFVQGAKEHGDDFLINVDHLDEAYKEVIDQLGYIAAARHVKRLHDQRYQ